MDSSALHADLFHEDLDYSKIEVVPIKNPRFEVSDDVLLDSRDSRVPRSVSVFPAGLSLKSFSSPLIPTYIHHDTGLSA